MYHITVTRNGQFLDAWFERGVGFDVNIFIREMRSHGYGLDIETVDFRREAWNSATRGRIYVDRASEPHHVS